MLCAAVMTTTDKPSASTDRPDDGDDAGAPLVAETLATFARRFRASRGRVDRVDGGVIVDELVAGELVVDVGARALVVVAADLLAGPERVVAEVDPALVPEFRRFVADGLRLVGVVLEPERS